MNDACERPAFEPAPEEVARVLSSMRVVALVGASPKPERPSHGIMAYLLAQGLRVVPVNPGQSEVLGEKCYPSLADVPGPVDVADLFINAALVPAAVDQAIAKGVKAVWMQSGIVHNAAAEKARKAGLFVVMNRCIKVEHAAWRAVGGSPQKLP
jgi:uncharacterized protein